MARVDLPPNNSENFVNNKLTQANNFAREAFDIAKNAIDRMSRTTRHVSFGRGRSINVPSIDLTITGVKPVAPVIDTDVGFVPPTLNLKDISPAGDVNIPAFTGTVPTVKDIQAPIVTDPLDPGDGPSSTPIDISTKPSITDHILQDIGEITIPTAPDIPIARTFEDDLISTNIIPPENIFIYNEQTYDSVLGNKIYTWLSDQVDGGGTGLGSVIESALFQRARDRRSITDQRTYDEAENYHASRGWNIPTGALQGALTEALREQTRSDEQLNYEIMIEMARLAQNNTHFIINSSIENERQLMGQFNSVANRVFEVAKYTADNLINLTNTQISIYNSKLEAQKSASIVFSAKVQSDLVELEKFKIMMEASKLEADIKSILVEVFRAKIEAEKTKVQIYAIEMDAAKILGELQRNDIERYKAIIDAYIARINANTAKYNIYQAEIAAETSKVELYKVEAEAYESHVRGLSMAAEVEIKNLMVQIEHNKALIDEYKAIYDGYMAAVDTKMKQAEIQAQIYGADIDAYRSVILADTAVIEANIKQAMLSIEAQSKELELGLEKTRMALEEGRLSYQFDINKLESVAKTSAQVTASALGSVNASAQIGMSTNYGAQGDITRDVPTTSHQHMWHEGVSK